MNKQFKKELFYIIWILAFVAFVGWDIQQGSKVDLAIPSTRATLELTTESPIPTPKPTGIQIEEVKRDYTIEEYIKVKFGKSADKALTILKGKGEGTCAENRTLDPNAIYINTDGSRDRGYWMINSYYHPQITDKCAKDIKCSTDYAYKLFKQRGNFSAWVCGKVYGY